jgi:hypothetical protein
MLDGKYGSSWFVAALPEKLLHRPFYEPPLTIRSKITFCLDATSP